MREENPSQCAGLEVEVLKGKPVERSPPSELYSPVLPYSGTAMAPKRECRWGAGSFLFRRDVHSREKMFARTCFLSFWRRNRAASWPILSDDRQ